MNPYIGKTLGNYRLVEQIGQGGMATVFKAYQPSMDRYVAVKILPSHFTQDATFVARFTQEARVLARLEHPHILPVYDYGEQEGVTYLVMRYVEAGTLHDLIVQHGTLPLREIARLMGQVGRALGYAHGQGVIHRDIKPSNVLIDPQGNAFLTDFGIAKIVAGTANYTGTGAVIGTPAYMAPEQGLGKPLDARCDIYALGVMLYEMVTGQVPFDAETPLAVMMKHVYDPLPLPRSLRPDIPEVIERIILKALAKLPEDRFQSAVQMVETLERAVDGLPTEITLPPIPGGPTAVIPTPVPFPPKELPTAQPPIPAPAPLSPPSPAREATTEPVPERKKRPFPWLPVVGGVVGLIILVVALLLWRTPPSDEDEEPLVAAPRATQVAVEAGTPVPALFSTELTLDNRDAACVVEGGQWDTCEGEDCGGVSYGEDFLYANLGCLDCRIRCNFLIEKGGLYDVWAWWPRGEDRATDTPFTLVYPDGETVVHVNQRDQGNDWHPLATLSLADNTKFSVIVGGTETGYANLDAVRLTPATGWRSYINHNILYAVAIQGDYVWGGGPGGVVRWNPARGTYDLFTQADGLPDSWINALVVDDDERLWAATRSGIAVFDGEVWSTASAGDGSEPAWTSTLFKDANGDLWATTLSAESPLLYHDDAGWRAAPTPALPVSYARPLALAYDEDAGLFVALENQGLARFDGQQWRLYTLADGLPDTAITDLQIADEATLYLTFWKGAARMDVNSGAFTRLSALDEVILHTVHVAGDDRVWFGGAGVFVYDPDDDEWTTFSVETYPELAWPVHDIVEHGDVVGFVTEGAGLLLYDGDEVLTWTEPATLNDNHVHTIIQDNAGALWFAHAGAGLTRHVPGQGIWQAFGEAEGAFAYPGFPGVDGAGRVWIGGYGELRWYDGSGWRIMEPNALDGLTVYGVTFGPDDIMWVWGYERLLRYDSGADSWATFTPDDHPLITRLNALYAAPDGTCWIAGEEGLAHYDGDAWTTEAIDGAAEVNAISGTPNGDVWAASSGDLYHRTADGWERYDWPGGWILGLWGAADNTVWVWGDKLGRFNPADGTWQTFTTADGLVPGDISSVWITPQGVVWVGTNRGVSRYVP